MRDFKENTTSCKINVSVIVPVYNVENYIEECLESLVGQSLTDIEILLIDDGSTDTSGAICDKYAQNYENIRVIHKMNQGLGSARNVGFSLAKGKYVYFIDSDDALTQDALRYLYEESEKEQLDVLLFSAECFSDDTEIDYNASMYKRTAFLNEVKSGKDMFWSLYTVGEYYASIPLRFYNRFFLQKNAFSFPEGIIHEDEAYGCLSLLEAKRAKCVAFPFYRRRFRQGSIMTSKQAYNSAMGYVYTWKILMETYKNIGLDYEDKTVYLKFTNGFLCMAVDLYFGAFNSAEKIEFEKVRHEIKISPYYNVMGRGTKLFVFSPFLYKLCKCFMNICSFD